jgi:hypothetical protein
MNMMLRFIYKKLVSIFLYWCSGADGRSGSLWQRVYRLVWEYCSGADGCFLLVAAVLVVLLRCRWMFHVSGSCAVTVAQVRTEKPVSLAVSAEAGLALVLRCR